MNEHVSPLHGVNRKAPLVASVQGWGGTFIGISDESILNDIAPALFLNLVNILYKEYCTAM